MGRQEERKIIRRAQRGDADAFRSLVELYSERLYAFVRRMMRDHHEAEDICQTAFVRAYESLAKYSEQYAFSTWLFTIAYRLTLNSLRKRRALTGEVDPDALMKAERHDAADVLIQSEEAGRIRQEVWAAVDRLTPAQRSAVVLFYCERMRCQEIGVVLGVPSVTVKSHLHRAREKLRQILSEELVDDWFSVRDRVRVVNA